MTNISAYHYHYRLQANRPLSAQVRQVLLQADDADALRYQAGQFLAVRLANGVERSYSPAAAQRADGLLELHVRLQDGGAFSEWLRHEARPGDTVQLSGPYGACTWQQQHHGPVLMLATGTGIAPLKALLEQALHTPRRHPITLYWGGQQPDDLYLRDHFQQLAAQHPAFRFVPVLAQTVEGGYRSGLVQQVAASDHPQLGDACVYACGNPAMIADASRLLTTQCGLPSENFFADAFLPSTPAVAHQGETLQLQLTLADGKRLCVDAQSGSSLLQALAAAGLLGGVCGGNAACGTCRVDIAAAWLPRLPAAERKEQRLLAVLDGPQPAHRLACQIRLHRQLDGLQLALPIAVPA